MAAQTGTNDELPASPIQPIDYAATELNRRPRRFLVFGILSVCLGLGALGVNGLVGWLANVNLRQASTALSAAAPPAMQPAVAVPLSAAARGPAAGAQRSFAALNPQQAQQVIGAIGQRLSQSQQSATLSDSQRKYLLARLESSDQPMIDPALPMPSAVAAAAPQPSRGRQWVFARPGNTHPGDVLLTFRREYPGQISNDQFATALSAAGVVIARHATDSISSADAAPSNSPPPEYVGQLRQRKLNSEVFLFIAVVFSGLALWLALAGLWLIIGRNAGVRPHVIYARLKLTAVAVSVAVAWGLGWLSPADGGGAALILCLAWVLGCVYPVIILRVLRPSKRRRPQVASDTDAGTENLIAPPADECAPARAWFVGIGWASIGVGCIGLVINWQLLKMMSETSRTSAANAAQQDQAMNARRAAEAAEEVAEQTATANPPRGLTPAEAAEFTRDVQSITRLTPPQAFALGKLLQQPGQWLIDPTLATQAFRDRRDVPDSTSIHQTVVSAIMNNGEVVLEIWHRRGATDHGAYSQVIVEPDGKLNFMQVDSPAGRDTFTATGTGGGHELSYTTIPNVNPSDQMKADEAAFDAAWGKRLAEADVSLSLLLLIAGLLVLAKPVRSNAGVALHWCYVAGKLLAVVIGVCIFADMASTPDPGSPFTPIMQEATVSAFALAGAAYPVLLIFLLIMARRKRNLFVIA